MSSTWTMGLRFLGVSAEPWQNAGKPVPIKEHRNKTFELKIDRGGLVRADLRFVGCTFDKAR